MAGSASKALAQTSRTLIAPSSASPSLRAIWKLSAAARSVCDSTVAFSSEPRCGSARAAASAEARSWVQMSDWETTTSSLGMTPPSITGIIPD